MSKGVSVPELTLCNIGLQFPNEIPMNFDRYYAALQFATGLHGAQTRKGSGIPYLTHLMAVSGLVLEYGGDLDQAIAGLLHDAIEDQAEHNGGVAALSGTIAGRFGPEVLRIVLACTDAVTFPKPPWRERKEAYLQHLAAADARAGLVSAADKLHNARTILSDVRIGGEAVFRRFSVSKRETIWYYDRLAATFITRFPGPLSDELLRTVEAMQQVSGSPGEGTAAES